MTPQKKRVKKVKAWAVVDKISGALHYDFNEYGSDVNATYKGRGDAERWAEEMGAEVIPCTITYSLPTATRPRNKRI